MLVLTSADFIHSEYDLLLECTAVPAGSLCGQARAAAAVPHNLLGHLASYRRSKLRVELDQRTSSEGPEVYKQHSIAVPSLCSSLMCLSSTLMTSRANGIVIAENAFQHVAPLLKVGRPRCLSHGALLPSRRAGSLDQAVCRAAW